MTLHVASVGRNPMQVLFASPSKARVSVISGTHPGRNGWGTFARLDLPLSCIGIRRVSRKTSYRLPNPLKRRYVDGTL